MPPAPATVGIGLDFGGGAFISLGRDQLHELGGIGQTARETIQSADHRFEAGALLAELLGAVGGIPDSGLFQLADYFLQPFMLVVVFKDTPSRSRFVPRVL